MPRSIRAVIALLVVVATAGAILAVLSYQARHTLLAGIAPLEQALTADDRAMLDDYMSGGDIGAQVRQAADAVALVQWTALALVAFALFAHLVGRRWSPARIMVMMSGIGLTIVLLVLMAGDTHPYNDESRPIGERLSAAARARWEDLDVSGYYAGAWALELVCLAGLVTAVILASRGDAGQFFRRETTADDPRLWTIKPRE